MDQSSIGSYIRILRTRKGMTQRELADAMGVSFQAVSKWENGENLPDTALLVGLADLLEVSVDKLLRAGAVVARARKRMTVEQIKEGFSAMERVRECLGAGSLFYLGMVNGINRQMNMDLEAYLADPQSREFLYAEAMLQAIDDGWVFDLDDVDSQIKNPRIRSMVQKRMEAAGESMQVAKEEGNG